MKMNKLCFLLFVLIVLLVSGCDSGEHRTIEPTSEETANISIGRVIRSDEFEQRVETEQIPQNNCEGKSSISFSINRERSLEQRVDITLSGEGKRGVELSGKPMEIGIASEIITTIGAEYSHGNAVTVVDGGGMVFTIEAGDFPTYIIVWREKWEKGYIEVKYNGEDLEVPYLYLTAARPELVSIEYTDCETGQPLLSSTPQGSTQIEITEHPISSQPINSSCVYITKLQLEELKQIQDVSSAIKQAETFAGNRQNDYKEGETIPTGVLIATDLRSADIEQFGVVPISSQGGWGLFLTTRDLRAPNAGTYWCIR